MENNKNSLSVTLTLYIFGWIALSPVPSDLRVNVSDRAGGSGGKEAGGQEESVGQLNRTGSAPAVSGKLCRML